MAAAAASAPVSALASTGADLAVTVGGPAQIEQGTSARYLVSYANNGPDNATNAVVTVSLDPQLYWKPIDTTGNCVNTTPPGPLKEWTFVCAVGTVNAGQTGSFWFAIQAFSSTPTGAYKSMFKISADQSDPKQQNNAAPLHIDVVAPYHADVWTGIVRDYSNTYPYAPNQEVWLDAQYGNNGPAVATNAVESFHLPPSFTFIPAASDPRCSASGETVTCPLGTLPVDGSTNDMVIAFSVGPDGTYTVAASISADQPDQQISNNTSTHAIYVTG